MIQNAMAGVGWRRLVSSVVDQMIKSGAIVNVVNAASAAEDAALAREASRSRRYDAVLAAGGDGTVRGVASGLAGSEMPLGVIPVGTGNVFATEMGLTGGNVEVLCRHYLGGPLQHVKIGYANDHRFLLMASVGFDAHVLGRLNQTAKRKLGRLAYALPILSELRRKPTPFEVLIDDECFVASWLIVSRASRYAGSFRLLRGASLEDDGYHAVVVGSVSRRALASVLAAISVGRIANHSAVRVVRCSRVEVPAGVPGSIQVDGELTDWASLRVCPCADTIRVIGRLGLSRRPQELVLEQTSFEQSGKNCVPQARTVGDCIAVSR